MKAAKIDKIGTLIVILWHARQEIVGTVQMGGLWKWPQEECIVCQPAEAAECESTVMCDTNCVVVIIGLSFDWGWLRAAAGVVIRFLSDCM